MRGPPAWFLSKHSCGAALACLECLGDISDVVMCKKLLCKSVEQAIKAIRLHCEALIIAGLEKHT